MEVMSESGRVQKSFWLTQDSNVYLKDASKRLGISQTGFINMMLSRLKERDDNNQPVITIREEADLPELVEK